MSASKEGISLELIKIKMKESDFVMKNNKLIVKGKIKVCGIEVPNVYGGFGGDQRVILAKTVAELHSVELKTINQSIKRHIEDNYFEEGIDFVDLKNGHSELPLSEMGFSKRDLTISKNIYLLSQQGYTLLLKLMNSELARKQYKKVIRDYFTIKNSIQILTQAELKQLITREDGIIRRNRETSAISKFIQNGELPNGRYTYATITNTTYDIIYGMYAKEIKEHLDLKQQDNIRDFLSTPDLSLIREVEDEIVWMCKKGYTWREIYRDLVKEYPNQVEPVRAEKSIKELKKAKRFAIDSNEFKKLT